MKLEIQKIALKDLETFVNGTGFSEMEFVPISKQRVQSYLSNPNALPDDIVLYLGFHKNELLAFRSLWADKVHNEKNNIRFAWCSGNWVHPNYRRLGFSEQLLMEANTDWDNKLMFTNYAPNSEQLYIKSKLFKAIHTHQGIRAYLFPETVKILQNRVPGFVKKWFLPLLDFLLRAVAVLRCFLFRRRPSSGLVIKSQELPDEQCYEKLEETKTVFERNKSFFKWVFESPWLHSKKGLKESNYPFSNYSEQFYYRTLKLFKEEEFVGFLLFSVREGHLKTLYHFYPSELSVEIAQYLKEYCVKHKIETLSIYKKELANELFQRKFPFLHLKKYGQKIYSTFEVTVLPQPHFQDGDGDVIFT